MVVGLEKLEDLLNDLETYASILNSGRSFERAEIIKVIALENKIDIELAQLKVKDVLKQNKIAEIQLAVDNVREGNAWALTSLKALKKSMGM